MESPDRGITRRNFLKQGVAAAAALSMPALLAACGSQPDVETVENEDKEFAQLRSNIDNTWTGIRQKIDHLDKKFAELRDAKATLKYVDELEAEISALLALSADNGGVMKYGLKIAQRAIQKSESFKTPSQIPEEHRSRLREAWMQRATKTKEWLDAIQRVQTISMESLKIVNNAKDFIGELIAVKLTKPDDVSSFTKRMVQDLNRVFRP